MENSARAIYKLEIFIFLAGTSVSGGEDEIKAEK
jgi:hypothetical protein